MRKLPAPAMVLVLGITLCLLFQGCARVPKEVVELSYTTGQDMASLQDSYDNLIHEFYNQLRDRRLEYLEESWTPLFVENWVAGGRLIAVARGDVVWSEEAEDFVAPTPGNEQQELLQTVLTWADEAVYQIELKRDSLLKPLDREEAQLRRDVKEAFVRIIQANAAITAHLNSLREVQEIQDETLDALGIKELRDKINQSLIKASEQASKGLDQIRKADAAVLTATEAIDDL